MNESVSSDSSLPSGELVLGTQRPKTKNLQKVEKEEMDGHSPEFSRDFQ